MISGRRVSQWLNSLRIILVWVIEVGLIWVVNY